MLPDLTIEATMHAWPPSSDGGDRQTCWFYLAVCAKKIILPPPTAGPANEFPGPQPFGNH